MRKALLFLLAIAATAQAPSLRLSYLEARVANAEAVAHFEQSLSSDQKTLMVEVNRAAVAMSAADKAIVDACKELKQDLKRKPNGEPFCVEPTPAAQSSSTDPATSGRTNPERTP